MKTENNLAFSSDMCRSLTKHSVATGRNVFVQWQLSIAAHLIALGVGALMALSFAGSEGYDAARGASAATCG
jgi:hypothetical protein